jgi:hypothetical protein
MMLNDAIRKSTADIRIPRDILHLTATISSRFCLIPWIVFPFQRENKCSVEGIKRNALLSARHNMSFADFRLLLLLLMSSRKLPESKLFAQG